MYSKEFDIRWSDIDANGHLANSAYINFMSHTRMGFFVEKGITQKELAKHHIGPVVFHEHIYYFKEVFQGKPIKVTLEVEGLSEDGQFFEFIHNFYDHKGRNLAYCEIFGGWIDLNSRKLTGFPKALEHVIDDFPKSKNFKVLTKEDSRKFGRRPEDLT